jgi:gliding motility-associated-like protein
MKNNYYTICFNLNRIKFGQRVFFSPAFLLSIFLCLFSSKIAFSQVAVSSVTVCVGASATLTATGAATYSWSTGATTAAIVVSPSSTASYTVTGDGDPLNVATSTVTVGPVAIATPSSSTICSFDNTNIALSSNLPSTTFSWVSGYTNANDPGSGSGSTISESLVSNPLTTEGFVTFSITPQWGSCLGEVITANVQTNPFPEVSTFSNQTICSGNTSSVYVEGNLPGIIFNWVATPTSVAGSSNAINVPSPTTIAQTLTTVLGGQVRYLISPSLNGCSGDNVSVFVRVDRIPSLTTAPLSQTVCSGGITNSVTLTSNPAATFSWIASAPPEISGYATSGTSTIPSQTLTNTGTSPGVVTYTITLNNCAPLITNYTIIVNPNPSITLGANPAVCRGEITANLPYSSTTASPNRYNINFDATAEAAGFTDVVNAALPASPIPITVPALAPVSVYNATIVVSDNTTGCTSGDSAIAITVNPIPTITLGNNPTVCQGVSSADITYSSTTGIPNQYSVDYDAAAEAIGFVDITNAALPASPISLVVPVAAAEDTYNAIVTVRNSATGCVSGNYPISIIVNNTPAITLGSNPAVCRGANTTNLTYSVTSGSPNEYTINYEAAAELQGFVDVAYTALPISPIVLSVPVASAVGTYTATLEVRNSTTGCFSSLSNISVTVNPIPTITLSANPTICQGAVSAALVYTGNSGSPNQYSINYNAAAELAGFLDVANSVLPASPISMVVPGAISVGTYNGLLTVRNSTTGCQSVSAPTAVVVTASPSITLGSNPEVCSGAPSADLTYSSTSGSPNRYNIDYDAAAEAEGFADINNAVLPSSPISLLVPGVAQVGTYNATLTVTNSITGCSSSAQAITVTINPNPTITLGTNPEVCRGALSANLTYSSTSGSPNEYSIDYGATAEAQGFSDISYTALPVSPISLVVPGAAAVGSYSATISLRNTATGCVSVVDNSFSIIINLIPTISLGASPSICSGSTSASLTYASTSGSPNQYSINYNGAAEAQGFVDVVNSALPVSPISMVVPGGAVPATYNATLTVRNSITGCASSSQNISVTINSSPTITLGPNPTICLGTITADLTYSSVSNNPTNYSITYDIAAQADGFIDVANSLLPLSPINLNIPITASANTYNATIFVTNNVTGCSSVPEPISITINPDASFSYGSGTYCQAEPDPTPVITGLAGGVFSSSPALTFISTATGQIDLSASALGTYTISYTIGGLCASTSTQNLVITSTPDPEFDYSGPYCLGTTPNPTPSFGAGATAGTFSATPVGLVFVSASTGVIDLTASLAGTYTVTNRISCAGIFTHQEVVTLYPIPSLTLDNNTTICQGTTVANLAYSSTLGSPDEYSVDYDAIAEAAGFTDVGFTALPASPIVLTVPLAASASVYNATIVVRNSSTTCVSNTYSITITINPTPSITLGANPSICQGVSSANLSYSSTSGGTNEYSLNYDATAELAGFTDVTFSALPVSPLTLAVPVGANPATYNASLGIRNTITGCVGANYPIEITVETNPAITLGANPSICQGATITTISYGAAIGAPDEYSIDYNAGANAAGFVDVSFTPLPLGSIPLAVPGALAAGTYSATIIIRNSNTQCVSSTMPVVIVVNPLPTITLGSNPEVCQGVTVASLAYSSVSSSPNQYSIDYNLAAEAAGFTDVNLAALPVSPISINVPVAVTPSTYIALLNVRNSTTGCVSTFYNLSVIVNSNPTITLSAVPAVCQGVISSSASFTSSGSPNQYSIDYSAAANTVGFTDLNNNTLSASPLILNVPIAATPNTYTASLTVTNTITSCSSVTNTLSITINPNPTITLGANPTVCQGTTLANLPYSATTGTPDQYTIDYNNSANVAGFADVNNSLLPASPIGLVVSGVVPPSTYNATLTVRNSVTGCSSGTNIVSLVVRSLDDASFAYSSGTYCKSGSNPLPTVTGLTGGIFSTTPGLVLVSTSTGRIDLSASSVGTHTVTYTTNGLCPNSSNMPVSLITSPDPSFSYSGPYCTGAATNPAPTFSVGASAGVFSAIPSGLVFENTSTGVIDLSLSSSGTYTVTNSITCSGTTFTSSAVVTINYTPELSSTLTPPAICSGNAFNYIPSSLIGGAAFFWSRATLVGITELGTSAPGAVNEVLTNSTTSPITVTYVYVTSANGCSNIGQNVNVIVNPLPQLNSSLSPPAICSGNSFNYTPTSATSGAVFTWQRNTIAGITEVGRASVGSVNESLTNTTSSPISATYTFTSFANGCSNLGQDVIVSVIPLDDASFTYPYATYCQSDLDPTPTISGLAGGLFISNPALLFVSNLTGEVDLSANGLGAYAITYNTNGACPNSSSIALTITSSPNSVFSYSGPYCERTLPHPAPIFASGSSAGFFTASPSGLVFENANTGVIDLSASVAGVYTVTNVVNNCSGNPIISTGIVTINASPFLSTTSSPPSFCSGSPFNYTANTIIPTSSILWSRNSVAGIMESPTSGSGNISEILTNTTALPIDVNYTYTLSTISCSISQEVVVSVKPVPLLSSSINLGTVCSGTLIDYTANSGTPGTSFSWSRPTIIGIIESGTSGVGNVFEQLNNNSISPINVVYTYITSANGCSSLGQDVSLTIVPITTVVPSSQTICSGSSTSILLLSPVAGTTFEWTVLQSGISGALPDSNKDNITQTLHAVGSSFGTAVFEVQPSASGCAGIPIQVPVTVNLPISVNAGIDAKITYSKSIQLGESPSGAAGLSYLWTPSTGLSNSNSPNPIASPVLKTIYEVTASSTSNGLTCFAKDTVIITVSPPLEIVNGFTPNGDGVNDVWNIDFLVDYPDCVVEVYNRWGQQLFLSLAGYTTKWNGMYNGQSLPIGTYYYVIKLNNPDYPEAYTGPVTILR